jgi:hypothetical protein
VPGSSSPGFERIQSDEGHPLKAWTIRDSLEESARLLERYEQGRKGYTYLSGEA